MSLSYNGLWKLMIDKNLNKVELMKVADISSGTVAKMTKGEPVSMTILMKICDKLDCDIGELVHYVRDEEKQDG
jgi:DNA-binding Xre family transcriptional regulator